MDDLVTRVGMIGLSAGNGHPFSFSALINGYSEAGFAEAGWPVIHDYLRVRRPDEFGFDGVRVTHAWTPSADVTERLCRACRIERPCATVEEMLAEVDAAIVARDDWESHLPLARLFLDRGKPVFIDKPLSLDETELTTLEPHLRAGRVMSASGLRYAAELDPLRTPRNRWGIGRPRLIAATVLNGLEKYGIHMIEAVAGLGRFLDGPATIARLPAPHEAFQIDLADGTPMRLDCLGEVARTFRLDVYGERGHFHADLHDNFTAFRRMLGAFVSDVLRGRTPPIDPDQTMRAVRLVRAGRDLPPCGEPGARV
jgi:predicted dehydrogenase